MTHPITTVEVTLAGDESKIGHLTGRTRRGRRCDLWQCYWTQTGDGEADNVCQWVPMDQIVIRPDMDVIRRCGGFREYANQVIMGPII